MTTSPSPSPSPLRSPEPSRLSHFAHASSGFLWLDLDQWLAIGGIVIGIIGAIFAWLQWRQARLARAGANDANKAQRDMVTEVAGLRTQLRQQHEATARAEHERDQTASRLRTVEARTEVYRDTNLWVLFGMELRAWERQQRAHLLPDRLQEKFTEPMPQQPFDEVEVRKLAWDTQRVSSERVRLAFQVAFITSDSWFAAHLEFIKEAKAAVSAGRAGDDLELTRLTDKIDEAGADADKADRALLDVMAEEVAVGD